LSHHGGGGGGRRGAFDFLPLVINIMAYGLDPLSIATTTGIPLFYFHYSYDYHGECKH